ncbi:hypothetical protein DFJ74DRAFT_665144 [Hyaloraphidium curvatum]|nr:hypothetical protein DFJ74DRAFT_665144 [Hyaloraphidium curvatum]
MPLRLAPLARASAALLRPAFAAPRTAFARAARPAAFARTYATRKYTPEHEWVEVTDGIATVGITDYAQKALGDVVYIEVPQVGKKVAKKDMIGAVESVKAASDIYAPLSGEVVEANSELEGSPSLINEEPYGQGWLCKMKISDPAELEGLMDDAAYEKHTASD